MSPGEGSFLGCMMPGAGCTILLPPMPDPNLFHPAVWPLPKISQRANLLTVGPLIKTQLQEQHWQLFH